MTQNSGRQQYMKSSDFIQTLKYGGRLRKGKSNNPWQQTKSAAET